MQSALAAAVLTLLKPLVRILLRNGIPYGAFAELSKKVFVDAAAEHSTEPGKKANVSRISALTGLTRKEAKRLHELQNPQDSARNERYNRAVRVISGWVNDSHYHDTRGVPGDLPMEGDPSFAALVKEFSGDVPTQAMLAVLEAAGSVQQRNGQVRLVRHAYVPGNDPVDKIHILGNDSGELIATIDHNLTAARDALRYQRKVSNHALRASLLPEFQKLAADRAQALLEEMDDWLNQHEVQEGDTETPCYVSLGIYYFERMPAKGAHDA